MSSARADSTDTTKDREIRQIIPTSGHLAVYFDEETGDPWTDALVGWALVADPTNEASAAARPKLIGLVCEGREVVLVDEFPNFLGYMSPDGSLDDWREDAEGAWEELNQKKERGVWTDSRRLR